MRLNKEVIKRFEAEQKQHGTEIALFNVIWEIASDLLKGIGVTRIRTSTKRKK